MKLFGKNGAEALRSPTKADGGYSFLELIIIIVVLGILVGLAIIRFTASRDATISSVANSIISDVSYAQEMAKVNNRGVEVTFIGAVSPPGGGGGGCFVATACYGPYGFETAVFRRFRDDVMIGNSFGEHLVNWYYRNGPRLAEYADRSIILKTAARSVLTPLAVVIAPFVGTRYDFAGFGEDRGDRGGGRGGDDDDRGGGRGGDDDDRGGGRGGDDDDRGGGRGGDDDDRGGGRGGDDDDRGGGRGGDDGDRGGGRGRGWWEFDRDWDRGRLRGGGRGRGFRGRPNSYSLRYVNGEPLINPNGGGEYVIGLPNDVVITSPSRTIRFDGAGKANLMGYYWATNQTSAIVCTLNDRVNINMARHTGKVWISR